VNWPFLTYDPDPKNSNVPPQRVSPAVNTAGIIEGLQISTQEFKEISGIYDWSLGVLTKAYAAGAPRPVHAGRGCRVSEL
jgi:hypothetical protein